MPMWPFGRKGKRASKSKTAGPEPVPHDKETDPYRTPRDSRPPRRRLSSKRDRARRPRPQDDGLSLLDEKVAPQLPPIQRLPENRFLFPRESAEDITALPESKELRISPHLRPATRETADIQYSFHPLARSRSSLQLAEKRGKLQRRPQALQSKRSAHDSLIGRKPSRKDKRHKKEGELREEELRAMSASVAPMKRPAAAHTGPLRRDSKKVRGGLNRHFERPTSDVSLPLEDSVHSSMSGTSEPKMYRITSFNVFIPRPTFRLSGPQYESAGGRSGLTDSARSESRRERRVGLDEETLKKSRTVDDLADDLDAGGLREIMERDERRRERKRKHEEERARRKLQRKAERERAEEKRREENPSSFEPTDVRPFEKETLGLGLDTTAVPEKNETMVSGDLDRKEYGVGTYYEYPSQDQLPDQRQTLSSTVTDSADAPSPSSPPAETPVEEPVVSTAQVVRYSQASPTHSPIQSPTSHTRNSSIISNIASLTPDPTPPPSLPQQPAPQPEGRSPDDGNRRRRGGWSAFFRRASGTARREFEHERRSPEQASFSNTSRESMSKQPLPAHLQQRAARASSGTPTRTRSRFREDLPELPLSPPDSRVQSPDVIDRGSAPIAARRGSKPLDIKLNARSSPMSMTADGPLDRTADDSTTGSPAQISAVQSTSLASVDSEGSWLSGRPAKRSSQQAQFRGSADSPYASRGNDDLSSDEAGMVDDEYFRRLAPGDDDDDQKTIGLQSAQHHMRKSTGKDSDVEGEVFKLGGNPLPPETVLHSGVARHPTVVHRDRGTLKSREGLLNEFQAGEQETLASSPTALTPEQGSPVEDVNQDTLYLGRAQSVDYGKGQGHARHLSAGSARLLEITKGQSLDQKRASGSSAGLG